MDPIVRRVIQVVAVVAIIVYTMDVLFGIALPLRVR
jgi:preprotein translocase subunit SecE